MALIVADSMEIQKGFKFAPPVLRYAIAVLLVVTAVLKAISPEQTSMLARQLAIPAVFSLALIPAELLIAWVLFHSGHAVAFRVASATFALLAAGSLYFVIQGFTSCGCFGFLTVSPTSTFVMDVGIAVLSFEVSRRMGPQSQGSMGKIRLRTVASYFLVTVPLTMYAYANLRLATDNSGTWLQSDIVILEHENWVGDSLPIRNLLSPRVNLAEGNWIVVLFHHDCPLCMEALPKYVEIAQAKEVRVLLVEVPPQRKSHSSFDPAIYATLPDDRTWLVQSPVEISLRDGIVQYASLDLPLLSTD